MTRDALVATARLAKCNKVFAGGSRIGLAVDGTSAGHTGGSTSVCDLCRPQRDDKDVVIGHRHEVAAISVVGVGVSLPLDVEPYGPGDSELVAGQRLLRRCVSSLGARFADYVAADAKFACAPFLNLVQEVGLHAIVRLKKNLPDLFGRAQVRFNSRPPDQTFEHRGERVEIWDEGGFQPWEGLNWRQVRVIRYLQYRAGKTTIEAYWLTDYPMDEVSSQALFKMAKSRWEIENEGFNEAKTRHGMEHLPPRRQLGGGRLAADGAWHRDRAALPKPLPAPRHPPGEVGGRPGRHPEGSLSDAGCTTQADRPALPSAARALVVPRRQPD
ncbi:MAG: hypothetical protein IPK26_07660 [Planctomycetes bacterium]|nr:hypothetical protein [Planctomycetota bacterium]